MSNADAYKVQWKSGNQGYSVDRRKTLSGSLSTSHTVTDLQGGTRYRFRVTAIKDGFGGHSGGGVGHRRRPADGDAHLGGRGDQRERRHDPGERDDGPRLVAAAPSRLRYRPTTAAYDGVVSDFGAGLTVKSEFRYCITPDWKFVSCRGGASASAAPLSDER